ncbi:MAG TPA: hypothetical protein VN040_14840 [Pseudosphingobacterium sp.]|nr:hypothetical protein [Pseudosphingobacterium sp.]
MEQLDIPLELRLPINYQAHNISGLVKHLRPVLFRKGEIYCCLLGPDTESGILGIGNSPQKAISDWERKVADRLSQDSKDDRLAIFLKNVLKDSN